MHNYLLIILLLVVRNLPAQTNSLYPVNYSAYFNAIHLIDPSYIPTQGNLNMGVSYRNLRFSNDIATISGYLEKVVRNSNNNSHLLRGIAYSEKEGPYISYPKFFFNYARGINVGKDVHLFSGVSLGFSRVSFSAPSGSGSGQFLDGGVGVGIKSKKVRAGFSCLQAFNNEKIILTIPVRLQRYYNLNVEYLSSINDAVNIKGYFLWNHYKTMPDRIHLGSVLCYKKFLEAGGVYHYRMGMSFLASIQFYPEINPLFISFAYNTNLFTQSLRSFEAYEISIRYCISNGRNVKN